MDNQMSTSVWRLENSFHQWTRPRATRSDKTIPNRVRRIKVCVGSGFNSIGLKRRSTPMCIHFKDVFPRRKKLWDLRLRTIGHYSSPRGMEALHSRITPHDDYFLRSQKFDVFPRSQKTEPATSMMVPLPIRIRCETSPHCRNENSTIGRSLQKARFHPRGRHG